MSWKNGGGWNPCWWGHNGWHGEGGWYEYNWSGKDASRDKYDNVTTLGLKHPLPIEDRRELVQGLLSKLQEEVSEGGAAPTGTFRIAVSGWGPPVLHAVLFSICRAKPSLAIRTLFNDEKKFVMSDAVDLLWSELTSLFPSLDEKKAVYDLLFQ